MPLDGLTRVLIEYRYWIILPLALVEGPMVAFVTAALSSRGYFNPYVVYWIFIVKDVVVDGSAYYLGRFAEDKPLVTRLLAKAHVTPTEIAHVRLLWARHGWRAMCVAKLSWGLSPALLAVAGIVAVPAALFFRYAVGIALVEYGILFGLGYYFGHTMSTVSTAIRITQYAVAGAAVIVIVYVRSRLRA